MDVDDQSEISFSIPQRTFPWQPILLVLSTELMGVAGCRRIVARPGGPGGSQGGGSWDPPMGRADLGLCRSVMQCNVNVEFKVTLHEQVRYRGTLQYYTDWKRTCQLQQIL